MEYEHFPFLVDFLSYFRGKGVRIWCFYLNNYSIFNYNILNIIFYYTYCFWVAKQNFKSFQFLVGFSIIFLGGWGVGKFIFLLKYTYYFLIAKKNYQILIFSRGPGGEKIYFCLGKYLVSCLFHFMSFIYEIWKFWKFSFLVGFSILFLGG